MSAGRATGEIVAELRGLVPDTEIAGLAADVVGEADQVIALFTQAADRLAELDADNSRLINACAEHQVARVRDRIRVYEAIDALRPPCPTCGGTHKGAEGMTVTGEKSWAACPDCPPDGRVSVEQLAATWRAVHEDPMGIKPEGHMKCESCALCTLEYLRNVRPAP